MKESPLKRWGKLALDPVTLPKTSKAPLNSPVVSAYKTVLTVSKGWKKASKMEEATN